MKTQDPMIEMIGKVADKMSDGMAITITLAAMAVGVVLNMIWL